MLKLKPQCPLCRKNIKNATKFKPKIDKKLYKILKKESGKEFKKKEK